MLFRTAAAATLVGAALSLTSFSSAYALSSHDCSVAYQNAQKAGTLNGMKYADFRKANCGSDAATPAAATQPAATTAPAATPSNPLKPTPTPTAAPAPTKPTAPAPTPTAAAKPTMPAMPMPTNAVFPAQVDPKYSNLSKGKAIQSTCVDQYNANKANNANGGMKWIEKGGGYWSACDKKLKGV